MGTYQDLQQSVFSVFGSDDWNSESILTYPSNFKVPETSTEYIRVFVIPSADALNLVSKAGVVIVDIYTKSGLGPSRTAVIADKLDTYLLGKSFNSGSNLVQFPRNSTLALKGVDSENSELHKASYTISFQFFRSVR